ncbi:GreA/GreB family elongation factor [Streptomyces sp. NPDC059506]|uniref:GreA/GreB family elongation factor n=1 Tax=Streptomyces TaxID=1883 RepID=UPI0015F92F15|nr:MULTISPECIES: GreA/GreB family elongation factor [unclassified Streptomyces]MCZ2527093.1 GreA/GreB family elongation factor [Streptomyces sp. HB2AG]QMV24596.1 nucleoside diphosphate kinase regulator [Streptomyces sp. SCUT-3]
MSTNEYDPARAPLTPAARRGLEDELEQLRRQRDEVARILAGGTDSPGDSVDQARTIEAMDRLAWLEDRIREVSDRLEAARSAPAPGPAQPGDVVTVGSTVTLEYSDGTTATLRVGDIAEDLGEGNLITPDSPLGLALLGRRTGETVGYDAPEGRLSVRVLETARNG